MGRLEGKVAIITGAGKGLGREFAIALAKEGAKIAVVTRADIEGLKETVKAIEAIGGEAFYSKVDVTSSSDCDRMVKETVEHYGRVDILINNAAYYFGVTRTSFEDVPEKEWDKMMAVNVKGPWLCARSVLPAMKETGKGKIINLGSEVFHTGSNGFVHYVASKGGIVGLTRALAVELGQHNICVNTLSPGFTDTEASRELADVAKYDVTRTPLQRVEQPSDLVGAAVFLASDESDFITGQTLLIDGGRAMN
jgi:3-oxoacyl-[acyl-carrier protein] reductase